MNSEACCQMVPRTLSVAWEELPAVWVVTCGCGWSQGCLCPLLTEVLLAALHLTPGDSWDRYGQGAFAVSDACNCSPGYIHMHTCTHTRYTHALTITHTCSHAQTHTHPYAHTRRAVSLCGSGFVASAAQTRVSSRGRTLDRLLVKRCTPSWSG